MLIGAWVEVVPFDREYHYAESLQDRISHQHGVSRHRPAAQVAVIEHSIHFQPPAEIEDDGEISWKSRATMLSATCRPTPGAETLMSYLHGHVEGVVVGREDLADVAAVSNQVALRHHVE